jgi:hypothetical protein
MLANTIAESGLILKELIAVDLGADTVGCGILQFLFALSPCQPLP